MPTTLQTQIGYKSALLHATTAPAATIAIRTPMVSFIIDEHNANPIDIFHHLHKPRIAVFRNHKAPLISRGSNFAAPTISKSQYSSRPFLKMKGLLYLLHRFMASQAKAPQSILASRSGS